MAGATHVTEVTTATRTCALCTRRTVETLVDFGEHPIAHQLLQAPDERPYTHPVLLGCCTSCGLTQLVDPIPPERLYDRYNWLSSWKWNPHEPRLLELIAALPVARDALVVEIGSNDGSFLAGLAERGFTNVVGVEPARDAAAAAAARGVETLDEFWDRALARELVASRGRAEIVVARQVLEHVQGLGEFVAALRDVMQPGTHVLVEVPDFGFNQCAPDYSAIWEEHVNHFTASTLTRLLAQANVEVELLESATFSGRILIAYGRCAERTTGPQTDVVSLVDAARAFAERWPGFRVELRAYLERERAAGTRIAVYGGGCRSSCLINYAGLAAYVDRVLDDQEAKQGRFMPGSALPIVPSAGLEEQPVDLCLLAVNAENEEAVIARHRAFVERGGRFVSLHPPSPRLPEFWRPIECAS